MGLDHHGSPSCLWENKQSIVNLTLAPPSGWGISTTPTPGGGKVERVLVQKSSGVNNGTVHRSLRGTEKNTWELTDPLQPSLSTQPGLEDDNLRDVS